MRTSVLEAFVMKGFLPPQEVAHGRVPGREEFSQPHPDEVVSFLTFHERGLGYPMHWFLCGLLNEWGLEIQHLNLMGVLHIASFVTVCEAFLRMELHVDFFRRLFSGRTMTVGSSAETASVGGFALQRKPSVGDSYPAYTPCDSNRGGTGSGFTLGIRRGRRFRCSPVGGQRSRKVGRGVAPARRGTR